MDFPPEGQQLGDILLIKFQRFWVGVRRQGFVEKGDVPLLLFSRAVGWNWSAMIKNIRRVWLHFIFIVVVYLASLGCGAY